MVEALCGQIHDVRDRLIGFFREQGAMDRREAVGLAQRLSEMLQAARRPRVDDDHGSRIQQPADEVAADGVDAAHHPANFTLERGRRWRVAAATLQKRKEATRGMHAAQRRRESMLSGQHDGLDGLIELCRERVAGLAVQSLLIMQESFASATQGVVWTS